MDFQSAKRRQLARFPFESISTFRCPTVCEPQGIQRPESVSPRIEPITRIRRDESESLSEYLNKSNFKVSRASFRVFARFILCLSRLFCYREIVSRRLISHTPSSESQGEKVLSTIDPSTFAQTDRSQFISLFHTISTFLCQLSYELLALLLIYLALLRCINEA